MAYSPIKLIELKGHDVNAETIGKALNGRKSGKGWLCRCVSHDDKSPSLWVCDGDKSLIVKCHAGCDFTEISTALRNMGLWPDSSPQEKEKWIKRKQLEEYESAKIWLAVAENKELAPKDRRKQSRLRSLVRRYESA